MDVINKLRSTITNVITGNPLVGEFDILEQKASGGPGMMWKIHNGIKRSTKQEVSIFILDKKLLERYPRRDRDLVIDVLKRGVQQMTRLKHPKILSVLHPVEDSREVLAFATEPVFMCLSNVLGRCDNLPASVTAQVREFKLYDVEIKYGLLHVIEALSFLHNDVKMVHNGLCPESVYINKNGAWKLSGFDFCIPNANQNDQSPFYPFKEWEPHLPPVTKPDLNYLAPEYALTKSCDASSDMFSLGVLMYAIFNGGKTLFDCRGEWNTFRKNSEETKRLKITVLGSIPDEARDHVKMLMNAEPTVRPDTDQVSKIPFFEDVGAMTLQYLDSLMQRDNLQKSQFFKSMPKILAKMPKRVGIQRILPSLFSECTNSNMIPFLLPNIMQIAEQCTEGEFTQHILPGLVPIFKLQDPVQIQPQTLFQITLVFLQNMSTLLSKTPQNDIRNHVLPMVYRALECGTPQIQEMCLNIIPTFASLVEYSQMKSALVPRIKKLCLGTTTLRLRVNCLVCLGKLLEYMDKWYVLDEIFPIMVQVPSREPAVLMGMLGIFKVAMDHKKLGITKEVMAAKVLPFLLPICVDNNLNLQQFNAYMALVKDMLEKVETEHRAKLEQLNSMQQEQRTLQQFAQESFKEGEGGAAIASTSQDDSMMDKFLSGIGLTNLFGSAGGSEKKVETKNPLNDMDTPVPKPEDTQLPNKPAKVNLTMEEKQRLARDQEQQERLKQQPKLMAKAVTRTTPKPQVKDLTASLMNTNMMATTAGGPARGGSTMGGLPMGGSQIGGSTMGGSTMGGSTIGGSPMGGSAMGGSTMGGSTMFGSGGGTMSSFGTMNNSHMNSGAFTSPTSNSSMLSQFGQPMLPAPSTEKKNIDMSAFDNLLPGSGTSRVPMKQMTTAKPTNTGGGFVQRPPQPPFQQNMMGVNRMGQPGMMGNMGMMGNQSTMPKQGMMGNQLMIGNAGFGQPMQPQINATTQNGSAQKLSNKDLADFLG